MKTISHWTSRTFISALSLSFVMGSMAVWADSVEKEVERECETLFPEKTTRYKLCVLKGGRALEHRMPVGVTSSPSHHHTMPSGVVRGAPRGGPHILPFRSVVRMSHGNEEFTGYYTLVGYPDVYIVMDPHTGNLTFVDTHNGIHIPVVEGPGGAYGFNHDGQDYEINVIGREILPGRHHGSDSGQSSGMGSESDVSEHIYGQGSDFDVSDEAHSEGGSSSGSDSSGRPSREGPGRLVQLNFTLAGRVPDGDVWQGADGEIFSLTLDHGHPGYKAHHGAPVQRALQDGAGQFYVVEDGTAYAFNFYAPHAQEDEVLRGRERDVFSPVSEYSEGQIPAPSDRNEEIQGDRRGDLFSPLSEGEADYPAARPAGDFLSFKEFQAARDHALRVTGGEEPGGIIPPSITMNRPFPGTQVQAPAFNRQAFFEQEYERQLAQIRAEREAYHHSLEQEATASFSQGVARGHATASGPFQTEQRHQRMTLPVNIHALAVWRSGGGQKSVVDESLDPMKNEIRIQRGRDPGTVTLTNVQGVASPITTNLYVHDDAPHVPYIVSPGESGAAHLHIFLKEVGGGQMVPINSIEISSSQFGQEESRRRALAIEEELQKEEAEEEEK